MHAALRVRAETGWLGIRIMCLSQSAEMQLTVGPVGPRGQNFRGSGK